jgi:hypothetical protein
MWSKGFWVIFGSLLIFHLVEDLFWVAVARFTSIPVWMILGGVLLWALLSTVVLHARPLRKHWNQKECIRNSKWKRGTPPKTRWDRLLS